MYLIQRKLFYYELGKNSKTEKNLDILETGG